MAKRKPYPTKTELAALFYYDAENGCLVWKKCEHKSKSWNTSWAFKPAGGLTVYGYVHIGIDSSRYMAHRLIWIFHNGPITGGYEIDHIDGNRANNKISNLRLATSAQNNFNTMRGHGVHFDKGSGKWRAMISVENKSRHIGLYETKAEALSASMGMRNSLWGEHAYFNSRH
jgi:hypothetical protein